MADRSEDNETKKKGRLLAILSSAALSGALAAILINFGLSLANPLSRVDPESLPSAHTWVWWATHEFLERKQPADVVVLGSSLVMHPISRLDANYLGRDLDYVHHHRSQYTGEALSKRIGARDLDCYNFALPGGMVSDDYIVTRALLTSPERRPKVIVLGLSLRDFIDNGVRCAGATPAFKYLKRFVDVDDVIDLAMPAPWQRFDHFFGKSFYLWGKKLDLQVVMSEKVKSALLPFYRKHLPESKLCRLDLSRNLPSNLRSEVEEGMFIVRHDQPYSWEDNSREYRKRYRAGNNELFAIQSQFLERLLAMCSQNGIAVIVANMPLTGENMRLMPEGAYDRYLQVLAGASRRHGCRFIDLNDGKLFARGDFYDTSHMNASGGRKLADLLVETIAGDRALTAALLRDEKGRARLFARTAAPL